MSGLGRKWAPLAGVVIAAVWPIAVVLGSAAPVRALERPVSLTAEDLRLGVGMTQTEAEEARVFCQDTLARAAADPARMTRTCACFPSAWEARTSRLHRLVLPITLAPDAPESRRNLALIVREQGGTDEIKLRQLSTEYELAAKQAFRVCP